MDYLDILGLFLHIHFSKMRRINPLLSKLLIPVAIIITFFLSCDYLRLIFKGFPPPLGELKGKVVAANVKTPVEKAKVSCAGQKTYTDKKGEFILKDVPIRKQILKITKSGYRKREVLVDIQPKLNLLPPIKLTPGQEVGGNITRSETWEAERVYYVTETLYIEDGVTLEINPGVEIRFAPNTALKVYGSLFAEGSAEKKIKFIPEVENASRGFWKGIIVKEGWVKISHCFIQGASCGISVSDESTLFLVWSEIKDCTQGGIIASESLIRKLEYTTITSCGEYGIKIKDSKMGTLIGTPPRLHHNNITYHGDGIYIIRTSVNIRYNNIECNYKNGIVCNLEGSTAKVECQWNNIVGNKRLAIKGFPPDSIIVANNYIANNCGNDAVGTATSEDADKTQCESDINVNEAKETRINQAGVP
jgi:hypothetical protein